MDDDRDSEEESKHDRHSIRKATVVWCTGGSTIDALKSAIAFLEAHPSAMDQLLHLEYRYTFGFGEVEDSYDVLIVLE